MCKICAQYMKNICTIHAHYMHNKFTKMHNIHNKCTIYAQYVYNICTINAQYV